jgi:hypothetical protein
MAATLTMPMLAFLLLPMWIAQVVSATALSKCKALSAWWALTYMASIETVTASVAIRNSALEINETPLAPIN